MSHAARWIGSTAFIILLTLALVGCGTSEAPVASAGQGARAELDGPAASVYVFLEAARTGDDEKAITMLTSAAQQEATKRGKAVTPPLNDAAQFVVGEVRYLPNTDLAHVASRWTVTDPATGQSESSDITWVLRREEGQWRVGGMAVPIFKGRPPLLLNFEDLDDMERQKAMLEAELARGEQPGSDAAPQGEPIKR